MIQAAGRIIAGALLVLMALVGAVLAQVPGPEDTFKPQTDASQRVAVIASSIQSLMWMADDVEVPKILEASLADPRLIALEARDNSADLGHGVWRDKDGKVHVLRNSPLPAEVRQRAGQTVKHLLVHEGKSFGELLGYFKPSTGSVQLSIDESKYLAQHPSVRVSNSTDYPPFDFAVGGQPQGYSIDLLNLLAARIGLKIEYVTGPTWGELKQQLKDGKLELLHSLDYSAQMTERGVFSQPYSRSKSVFVNRKGDADIAGFAELKGKTLAAMSDSENLVHSRYPGIRLLKVKSVEAMLDAVSSGKADATYEWDTVVSYWLRKKGLNDLKIAGWVKEIDLEDARSGGSASSYFYASKRNAAMVSMLNKAMATLAPGDLQVLQTKWFGAEKSGEGSDQALALTDTERTYLARKGAIKMCVLPNWLPYLGINDKGGIEGIGADLVALMQRRLGVDFALYPTKEWGESLSAMRERKCDILPLASDLPNRHDVMNFTRPYVSTPFVVATRSSELFIADASEIGSSPIGIVKGYSFAALLRQRYPKIHIVDVASTKDGLEQVSKGAIWGGMHSIGYSLQKHSMLDLKIAGKLEFDLEESLASRNDEPLLADIMQKAVDSISDAERRAIVSKWISIRFDQQADYARVWAVAGAVGGVAVLIIAVVVYWNRRLANVNKALDKAQRRLRRTLSELEDSAVTLRRLGDVGRDITANQDTQAVFAAMDRHLNALLDAFAFGIYRLSPDGKTLMGVFRVEDGNALPTQDIDLQDPTRSAARCARERTEIVINRPSATDAPPFAGTVDTKSQIYAPLMDGERVLGVMTVQSQREDAYGEREQMIFRTLCAYGAIALANAEALTSLRQAEDNVGQSLRTIQSILDSTPIGIYLMDAKARHVRVNAAYCALSGYSPEELLGHTNSRFFVDHETALRFNRDSQAVVLTGRTFMDERQLRRKDGSMLWMQLSANLLDPQDPSQGIVVAAEDTSLRKQSETALIESRDLAEAALTELRSAQAQMIQSEKMASLGQLVASVAHEINTPIAVVKSSGESLADALKQIQASNADFGTLELETRLLFARLMEQSASPATVLSSRDARQVTREVSRQLSEAGVPEADHKARVLVLLNAQSAVQEYLPLLRHPRSEFILSRAEDSATMINGIANINMAVDRVSKIVFALKSYSRSDASGEMRQADVREGIDTVLTIYHNQIKQGTELVRQFETIPPILCLPDELNQVWTNLIHNALQAMKNQGTLTVSVLQQGSEVVVSVADTGCGIPAAIRSRIFDPFFTTKPTGEGSGLGLDIVKKIMEKHQGRIEVQSEVGVGTTFSVYLPIAP